MLSSCRSIHTHNVDFLKSPAFVLFIQFFSPARPLCGLTYSTLKFMRSTCDKSKLGAIEELLLCLRRHEFSEFYLPHVGKQKPKTSIIARTSAKAVDRLYIPTNLFKTELDVLIRALTRASYRSTKSYFMSSRTRIEHNKHK